MKKILIASLLSIAASSSFAAAVPFETSPTESRQTQIDTTECTLLQEAVTINTSAANLGAVDCNTTTANIGVAVANTSGKNKIFSASSAGGGVGVNDLGASTVPTQSLVNTDAETAAATTGASS